jgi:hypothetical protein
MTYNSDNIAELENYFIKEQSYTKITLEDGTVRLEKKMNESDITKAES